MRSPRTAVAAAAVLALLTTLDASAAKGHAYGREKARSTVTCQGNPATYQLLSYRSGGGTAKALFVVPSKKPVGIVAFDHGYSHTMYSWVRHMQRVSKQLNVIAFAPDYRGQVNDMKAQPLPSSRGWRVAEGAVDTNTAAQLFDKACLKGRGHNVLYGVSMGGNTSGLALAAKPKRTGGAPLWDHWINVEGAANVLETYQGARVLAPVNTFAKNAQADIEQEMGGTPETAMQTYLERSVVNRVADIKASGVKGVVMIHGVADGLVTYDVGRQLRELLEQARVPVDFATFVRRSTSSEPGTTIDGYAPSGQTSPFAGHASEVSETHDVGMEGFGRLARLYRGLEVCGMDAVYDEGSFVVGSGPADC
jgi:hypothetical protein